MLNISSSSLLVSSPECFLQLLQAGHTLRASRRSLVSVRRTQLQPLHLMLQLLHLRLEQLHCFCEPEQRKQSWVRGGFIYWNSWSAPQVSPLDPLLGRPVVQNQFVVALLQLSGWHVQLLIHLSVLVVDLPEEVHLLRQVLEKTSRKFNKYLTEVNKGKPVYYYNSDDNSANYRLFLQQISQEIKALIIIRKVKNIM